MKLATKDAALALADDLQHIRSIVAKQTPDVGDIRRLSGQLRRLIVENDLRAVAAPRIGRIQISAPEIKPIYRSNDKTPFLFMSADQVRVCGLSLTALSIELGSQPRKLPGYDPDAQTLLRLEAFQNQRVLCFRGIWVTRGDIIKYIANVAHGVHTSEPSETSHHLIRKIRNACYVYETVDPGTGERTAIVDFNPHALSYYDPPITLDPKRIDLALLHLISTAQHLTSASDIAALEAHIAASG